MKNKESKGDLVFFIKSVLPKTNMASAIHFVNCANAAANIGYPAVLVYLDSSWRACNLINWVHPHSIKPPSKSLVKFYNVQKKLKTTILPNPWPIDRLGTKWISSAALAKRYFLPKCILPMTKLFYSCDWNFVKLAVERNTPSIFECHFPLKENFEARTIHNQFFKLAVANTNFIKEDMIRHGIPLEKIFQIHNVVNQSFLVRHAQEAEKWRKELLVGGHKYLAVYVGGLYQFKGIEILINVAKKLPWIKFVLAGGDKSQEQTYQKSAKEKRVENIKFLGHIPHNELVSLLQAADVLAHPHLSGEASTFTSPLKFFEYMASGVSIVATRILPLKEFEPLNLAIGWCNPDSSNDFAKCIQQVLNRFPRKEEGYLENINFARQFTWENRMRRILSRVDEVVLSGETPLASR